MQDGGAVDGVRRWRLKGAGLALHWASIVMVPVLVTAGVVIVLSDDGVPPLGFLAVWVTILTIVGVQLLRLATVIELETSGTLRLCRPLMGDVSVRADQVRRLGLGPVLRRIGVAGGSAPRYVEHVVGGRVRRVPLASGMSGLFELGTALREHNADVIVDLG